MAKNIIICCDGTGNEYSDRNSNVVKLYSALLIDRSRQVGYYHPGVGTMGAPSAHNKITKAWSMLMGLAFGFGLLANVGDAYRYLMNAYEDGDRLFLFGFSRGAYTVRVLAALIHKVGLLVPQQQNLADAALTAYKQSGESEMIAEGVPTSPNDHEEGDAPGPISKEDRAAQFARIVSARWPTIAFMGVWDTVASVIVPRPDRFYTFNFRSYPILDIIRACGCFGKRLRSMSSGGCFGYIPGLTRRSLCAIALARPTIRKRRMRSRFGSREFTPTSAGAIRRPRAGFRNSLYCG